MQLKGGSTTAVGSDSRRRRSSLSEGKRGRGKGGNRGGKGGRGGGEGNEGIGGGRRQQSVAGCDGVAYRRRGVGSGVRRGEAQVGQVEKNERVKFRQ